MFKQAMQWMFLNRKKEAHYVVAVAGAIATTWSTSQQFRTAVEKFIVLMPHWVQALAGLLTFAVPIWMAAKKILTCNQPAGAQ